MATLDYDNGALVLRSRFDRGLVDAIKRQIPTGDRKYNPNDRSWSFAPSQRNKVEQLVYDFLGEKLEVAHISAATQSTTRQVMSILYLGACKERSDGSISAMGWYNDSFSVVFPESVLKTFFHVPTKPGQSSNLYHILGVTTQVSAEDLKKSYRRLAMQWHPDRNKEPDAAEVFRRIQSAYDFLADPNKRKKYDIALAWEIDEPEPQQLASWRPPLKCGRIDLTASCWQDRYTVSAIHAWDDIVKDGKTLVSYWRMGDIAPTLKYV